MTIRWETYALGLDEALRTFDPHAAGAKGVPAKENLSRTAVPCEIAGQKAFLKIHRSRSPLEGFKQALAPKSRQEARLARRLREVGGSAPEPLAAGWDARGSYLLTRELAGARPLNETEGSPALARALGALMARLHRVGLWHPDLHAGNLLVSTAPDASPWLTVADLPSAKLIPEMPKGLVLKSLAMLAASLPRFRNADLLRALKAYRTGTLPSRKARRRRVLALLAERERIWDRHWRSRTRRCTRTTGAFVATEAMVRRRDFPEASVTEALKAHRETLTGAGASRLLKKDGPTSVSRGAGVCVKASRKSRRSWIGANALWERDCATARPLAWVQEGFLITEDLSSSAREMDRWLAERWESLPPSVRRRFLQGLAAAFRKLGERGVWPSDAKACNLFVRQKDVGFEFPLVDTDGVRETRPSTAALSRTLVQLHLSTPRRVGRLARARFLRALTGKDWRGYARFVLRMARGRSILFQSEAGDVEEAQP